MAMIASGVFVSFQPFRPFIITKDQLQKKVIGAGYPSLPTLTVEEFYEQKVKDGTFQLPTWVSICFFQSIFKDFCIYSIHNIIHEKMFILEIFVLQLRKWSHWMRIKFSFRRKSLIFTLFVPYHFVRFIYEEFIQLYQLFWDRVGCLDGTTVINVESGIGVLSSNFDEIYLIHFTLMPLAKVWMFPLFMG